MPALCRADISRFGRVKLEKVVKEVREDREGLYIQRRVCVRS